MKRSVRGDRVEEFNIVFWVFVVYASKGKVHDKVWEGSFEALGFFDGLDFVHVFVLGSKGLHVDGLV